MEVNFSLFLLSVKVNRCWENQFSCIFWEKMRKDRQGRLNALLSRNDYQ